MVLVPPSDRRRCPMMCVCRVCLSKLGVVALVTATAVFLAMLAATDSGKAQAQDSLNVAPVAIDSARDAFGGGGGLENISWLCRTGNLSAADGRRFPYVHHGAADWFLLCSFATAGDTIPTRLTISTRGDAAKFGDGTLAGPFNYGASSNNDNPVLCTNTEGGTPPTDVANLNCEPITLTAPEGHLSYPNFGGGGQILRLTPSEQRSVGLPHQHRGIFTCTHDLIDQYFSGMDVGCSGDDGVPASPAGSWWLRACSSGDLARAGIDDEWVCDRSGLFRGYPSSKPALLAIPLYTATVQDINVSIYVDWQQSGPRKSYRIDLTVPVVQRLVDESASAKRAAKVKACELLGSVWARDEAAKLDGCAVPSQTAALQEASAVLTRAGLSVPWTQ